MNLQSIFNPEKLQQEEKTAEMRQKVKDIYGNQSAYNPFLDKNGNLFNEFIDYQKLLDSEKVNNKVKAFISQATGLTPSQQTVKRQQTVKSTGTPAADTSVAYTPQKQNGGNSSSGQRVGFISAKYESGGNGGTVSSGSGDYGGVSYGIPQFSSKAGSADRFVSWLKQTNPDMGAYFGDAKAGTDAFSNAWKQVYQKYGDDFSNVQTAYAYDSYVKPLADLAKQKTGIDYTRSTALRELLYSTAIQFGSGNLGLSALGNVSADMSDEDIVNASYDKKIANYKGYFKDSSEAVQNSVKNRFIRERNDVLSLLG